MKDVAAHCDEILDLLEHEVELHKDLLELSQRGQGILITMDSEGLVSALGDVEAMVDEIRDCMEARLGILSTVERSLGLCAGTSTCDDVMRHAGEEHVRRYAHVLERLAPALERLAVVNSGNMSLVANILDYLDFAAQVLANHQGCNTYVVRKAGRPDVFHISRS